MRSAGSGAARLGRRPRRASPFAAFTETAFTNTSAGSDRRAARLANNGPALGRASESKRNFTLPGSDPAGFAAGLAAGLPADLLGN